MRRISLFLVVTAAAGLLAAAAFASATPVSPASGATITSSTPTFNWTLPANEQPFGIIISDSSALNSDGSLAKTSDFGALTDGQTSWSDPKQPLLAGTYYWQIETSDQTTYQTVYSTPAQFTVAPLVTPGKAVFKRDARLHEVKVTVPVATNVSKLSVVYTVRNGRKMIDRASDSLPIFQPDIYAAYVDLYPGLYRHGAIKAHEHLTVTFTFTGGGLTRTKVVPVTIP